MCLDGLFLEGRDEMKRGGEGGGEAFSRGWGREEILVVTNEEGTRGGM